MAFDGKGAGASRADPLNTAILAGCGAENSQNPDPFQPSRRARLIAQRFGLSVALAGTIDELAFGSVPDAGLGGWISLGDATALALGNLLRGGRT